MLPGSTSRVIKATVGNSPVDSKVREEGGGGSGQTFPSSQQRGSILEKENSVRGKEQQRVALMD